MHTLNPSDWFYNDSGLAAFEPPTHAISNVLRITSILDANCSSADDTKDALLLIHRYALSLLQYRPDGLFEAWLSELVDMLKSLELIETGRVLIQTESEVWLQYRDIIFELQCFITRSKTFLV